MIRFEPDSWVDVLMRPFDMVSPDANIYVEIAAPDVRLAAVVVLAVTAAFLWRRRNGPSRPTLLLLLLAACSMAPWLAMSGNGRYFLPWLVLSGPLCLGLVRMLPLTASMRLTMGALLVAVQAFLLAQNTPWHAWSWTRWKAAPYFAIDAPPATPVTYVTLSSITYSLVAPLFPPDARWINLATGQITPRDAQFKAKMLESGPLVLLAPTIPNQTEDDGRPTVAVADALDKLLAPHGLLLQSGSTCSLLKSRGLASMSLRPTALGGPAAEKYGFWLCPLRTNPRPASAEPLAAADPGTEAVFAAIERLCPRFFRPGEARTLKIAGGFLRQYGESDTKVYVLDDGSVLYKFWRSVNSVQIGSRDEVLAGRAQVDCSKIRAPNWRHGGP